MKARRLNLNIEQGASYLASALLFVAVWTLAAGYLDPVLLPSPLATGRAAWEMLLDGTIEHNMMVSYARVFSAWIMGSAVGAAIGLLLGRIAMVRSLLNPLLEFGRFIPPISFVTLFIIWLGVGEASKILLIAYTTVFIVAVNVSAGAASVNEGYLRAAHSLGASKVQIFARIVLPCCAPYIFTAMRLAMGNAFMTIVAAEILAAKSGIGHMIWHAQMYMQTDRVFVGFAALCVMGFTTDLLLQFIARRFFYKYGAATA